MRKWFLALAMLLLLPVGLLGQVSDGALEAEVSRQELLALNSTGFFDLRGWDSDRFGAYLNYDLPGSTYISEISAIRSTADLEATVRVSYKFSKDSATRLTRVDFLEPEELAGDVYLIRTNEDNRRLSEVFFWNPDLVSAIKIDNRFEVFGDANVFEVIGLKVGDGNYRIDERRFSDITPDIPAPSQTFSSSQESDSESVTIESRLAEYTLVPIEARRETSLFPKIRVFAFLNGSLYKIELLDESGDLLQTLKYDYRNFQIFRDDDVVANGFRFSGSYAQEQVIESHIIPGNVTTLTVRDIEIANLPGAMFEPGLLGR